MPDLMQVSQHLLPWGNVTCLHLACIGREEVSCMEEHSNIQKQAAVFPRRLSSAPLMSSLDGPIVSNVSLPWEIETNRDVALVTQYMFH